MTEDTLKSLLQMDDNEYNNIIQFIIKSDSCIGKHLLNDSPLLFNISLYSVYPILFRQIFNTANKERDILLFGRYYTGWLFILDILYDEKGSGNTQNELLVMSVALSAAEQYLNKIIPYPNEEALAIVNEYRRDSDFSMKRESTYFRYGVSYNECELDQYCVQKYALAKAILYLCYISAQKPIESAYNCIIKSHDCYAIARQLIDEIEDYSEDFKNNKFNVYANELLLKYGTIADEEVIKKQLLEKAFCKLNQAIDYIKELPDFGWKRFLTFSRDAWCQKWKI